MTHPTPPPDLSDEDRADWQQCQDEHTELMEQIADREFQIEAGVIDSYSDYPISWTYPQPPHDTPPRVRGVIVTSAGVTGE